MKKFFKRLGIAFLIILALLIILPMVFKGKIVKMVKEEINNSVNAKVEFGDFSLSMFKNFPNFSLGIENVTVDGVDVFEGVRLAEIGEFEASIDLMSVISGDQIGVRSVGLVNSKIYIQVLEDGTANYDIAKVDSTATEEPEEEEINEASEPAEYNIKLKKYYAKNVDFVYDDASMGVYTAVKGLNHTGTGDFTQDLFVLSTKTDIEEATFDYGGVRYVNKANLDLDADLDMDMPNMTFTFKENEARVNQLFLGFDGVIAMPTEDISMDITFEAKQTEFKNILSMIPAVYATSFSDVQTEGKLALNGHVKGVYNETTMPGFGVNLAVDNAMFKYPDLPKSVNNINISLKVNNPDGDLDKTTVDMDKFHMEIAGNPIDATLKVRKPMTDMFVDMGVKSNLDLASVRDVMPLEGGDKLNGKIVSDFSAKGNISDVEAGNYDAFDAKGSLNVSGMTYTSAVMDYDVLINDLAMKFSPQYVALENFDSKVGKSDFKANGRIDNIFSYVFKDTTLKGTFTLNSNLIDVNEFMPVAEEGVEAEETTEEQVEAAPMQVIEVPANVDFVLNANINTLVYDNMEIKNVKGGIMVRDQAINMNQLNMDLFDGSMTMNGSYDTKDISKPNVDFGMNIREFDVQKAFTTLNSFKQIAPVAESTTGKFSTNMTFKALLQDDMMPDMNSLTGGGKLVTKNVVVESKTMKKVADAVKNKKLEKLKLDNTNIAYEFRDGRVWVEPFDLKVTDKITAKVEGSNGFDQTLDYKMKMKFPASEITSIQTDALSKSTVDVGVKITGTVKDPKVKADIGDIAGDAITQVKDELVNKAKDAVDDAKKKAREEAIKQAKEQGDKLIAEAKKQGDNLRAEAKKQGDKLIAEAKKQGDKLVKDAGSNPIKKKLAQKTAKELEDAAKDKAADLNKKADTEANKLEAEAQQQAADLLKKAENG